MSAIPTRAFVFTLARRKEIRLKLPLLASSLLIALAVTPLHARADTIELASQSSGTDTFDLLLSGNTVTFNSGSTITVTGLSNFSNLSYVGSSSTYGTLSQTSTSVIFTYGSTHTFSGGSAFNMPLFSITTTAPVLGHAAFTIQESSATVTGSVSPTPEPASLVLLGTGLLGSLGITLRHRARPIVSPPATVS